MCTLTLFRADGQLTLTMNRDDVPGRAEAPPLLWGEVDRAFAAPVDLEAGGTWIGVNPAGVAACLLNRYDDAPKGARSRGEIVPRALSGADLEEAAAAVEALTASDYSPFTCFVASSDGAFRIDWDGVRLASRPLSMHGPLMLTSSSWRFEAVAAWRQALFEKILVSPQPAPTALSDFHCALRSGEEAWAPMMRRDYAHTKSVSQINIGRADIELRYWPREDALERGLSRPAHSIALRRRALT